MSTPTTNVTVSSSNDEEDKNVTQQQQQQQSLPQSQEEPSDQIISQEEGDTVSPLPVNPLEHSNVQQEQEQQQPQLQKSQTTNEPPNLKDAIDIVKRGDFFYKVRSPNKFYWRKYHVDLDNLRLHYMGGRKNFLCAFNSSPYIELIDAIEVRKGWNTDRFKKLENVSQFFLLFLSKLNLFKPFFVLTCFFSFLFFYLYKTKL